MKRIIGPFIAVCGLLISLVVRAAFGLSVTPYDGGRDLRFGRLTRVRTNKEITIRTTSTSGKQYRVIQRLIDPLSNNQGQTISRQNFVVYGLRGTNKFGTLLDREEPVSPGRTILYTSNTQGTADSFHVVYGIKNTQDVAPGEYRGRISFTLEPIDSSEAPQRVIMNLFAEVDQSATIEIESLGKGGSIYLDTFDTQSSDVLVKVRGNMGSRFHIVAVLGNEITNRQGEPLAEDALRFFTRETKKGSGIPKGMSLTMRKETIYRSFNGEPEDFIIRYQLGDVKGLNVGRYRGNVKYFLEMPGEPIEYLDTVPLEFENPAVFNLSVTPETGGILEFKNLKPMDPPRINEVVVKVDSNLGRPYQLSQKVVSEFVNKKGEKIPAEYFSLKTESVETDGTLKYPQKTQVRQGDMVLYVSDREGNSDTFKIIYTLQIPLDMKPGDYSTRIVYSILEL